VALSEGVTKLNTLVPDVSLVPCQQIVGEGKDRLFDEHFDYLLELANHGVFHANQVLFIIVTLPSPFQKKPGINLKTQTLKSGIANGSPSHNTPGSSVFSKSQGSTCGSSSKLGGPKGGASSHRSRWPLQQAS
jgi:hypothetical protein